MAKGTWDGVEDLTAAERIRPVLAITAAAVKADPWRCGVAVGLRFVGAAAAPLFALLVSRLAGVAAGEPLSATATAWLAVLFAVAAGATIVLDEIGWKVVQTLQERTSHQIDQQILGMVTGLPGVEHFERPDHLDQVDRLREDSWLLAQSVESLVNYAVMLFGVASTLVMLATVDVRLLALPIAGIPAVLTSARAEKIRRRYLDENSEDFRLWRDLLRLGTDRESAKEVRVFGLGPELRRRHDAIVDKAAQWVGESRVLEARLQVSGRAVFGVAYVATILWVAARVTDGQLAVSDLILTVVLAGTTLGHVRAMAGSANWLAWTLTAVRRWLWLTDYAADKEATMVVGREPAPDRLDHGLDLVDVSFRYPGTDVDVLRGVDLHIPAGATVAIVGDNGAGKTTLVKLLSRMYEPTGGRIDIDGQPLTDIDVESWRTRLSAAFQDHAPLELTAADTITVADLHRLGDHDAAMEALERAGAADVIDALPDGLDTQLGPDWPGGVDLSGGQWQKLSLARGMLRTDPLVLMLDEPTAALDAETEHRLFDRYAQTAKESSARYGTITILISHRFSTVRMADLIVVVAGGGIAEVGSHSELIARGGTYAELYGMQARAYR